MEKLEIINYKKDKILNILPKCGFSYNYACKLLRNKDVKIEDIRIKDNIEVEKGIKITVFYEKEGKSKNYEIVFEDDNIFVIDKKSGIEVEGPQGLEGAISGAIAVHRLDRNTEGLMVMAKNKLAEKELLNAFKRHDIKKYYLAEVVGRTSFNGEIKKAYLQKDKVTSQVKIYLAPGNNREEILTGFKTLKTSESSSVVQCELVTGKTHQIRAHLAYLGHPIIGDGKYGKNEDNKKFKKKSQQLFCYKLILNNLNDNLAYLNGKTFEKRPIWLKNN